VTADEPTRSLRDALPTLKKFGVDVADVKFRGSFAFIAQKSYPSKTVLRKVITNEESHKQPAHIKAVVKGTADDFIYSVFYLDIPRAGANIS